MCQWYLDALSRVQLALRATRKTGKIATDWIHAYEMLIQISCLISIMLSPYSNVDEEFDDPASSHEASAVARATPRRTETDLHELFRPLRSNDTSSDPLPPESDLLASRLPSKSLCHLAIMLTDANHQSPRSRLRCRLTFVPILMRLQSRKRPFIQCLGLSAFRQNCHGGSIPRKLYYLGLWTPPRRSMAVPSRRTS